MCAPCAWNGSTVPCGDAGVEEIIGLPFPLGMAGVVWVCFWVPGPPPHSLGLWRGSDAHAWCAGDAFGGSRGRAWRVAV